MVLIPAVLIAVGGGLVLSQMSRSNESAQLAPGSSSSATNTSSPVDQPIVRSLPTQLRIPRIGVDTSIEYVGLTSEGNMDVPSKITNAGWYKLGPLPGNTGSAVIAGHVNGRGGKPGVFAKLSELRAGDTIETVDTNGNSAVFTVQHTKRYDKDARPDEVFQSAEGTHLNLITCVGDWDKAAGQFSDRLVVFADML